MGKIKALYTKHKKLFLAFGAAFAVSIFWVLIRGHSSAKSAAGAVITSPTGTGATQPGQSDSAVSQLAASIKNQFDALNTKQDAQTQAANDQLKAVKDTIASNETAQGTIWSNLVEQIKNIGQSVGAVQSSVQSISSQQANNQTSILSRIASAVNLNTNTGSSAPSAPAGDTVSHTNILNFLSNAQNAVHNSVVDYNMMQSDEGRSAAHLQGQATRNNVVSFVNNLDPTLGYKVTQKDSGAGYSNIVVTAPNGTQTTY